MNASTGILIWSAVPTPLTTDRTVDETAVERMIHRAIVDGIQGLFLGGTCGEGPWLPDRERRRLIQIAARTAGKQLRIAAQISDNSPTRVLDNALMAAEAGADCAICTAPPTFMNATPARLREFFIEVERESPLPLGVYDLGKHRPIMIPEAVLEEIYLLPRVQFIKDSSGSPERRALALNARKQKPSLDLFNGDEFRCTEYLQAGYNGLLFGGAVATAEFLRRIARLWADGHQAEAQATDARMRDVLTGIYGGPAIACWLTGLKYYLVRRGLFNTDVSFLGYPLTDECRAFIERQAAAPSVP
jgi:dihydrodipicolinate synthase/N-acetylneuraminate lyase